MNAVRIYDLPTRVFHWSFAVLFAGAYAIANLVDDESVRFAWHILAGLLLGVAVVLRLVWGVIGTRHARLSDLRLDPRQLAGYLKGVVTLIVPDTIYPRRLRRRCDRRQKGTEGIKFA